MTTFESFESVSRRLRVVHSCDHCRSRKIKCISTPGQPKCDACVKHRAECTFQARDQYVAKRERTVATHMSSSGSVATTSSSLGGMSSIISFTASMPPASSGAPTAQPAALTSPSHSEYPPDTLMPHFIELFFKHYTASFPFLSYEIVVSKFLQSTLSPLASNAIASLGSRYSHTMPQLASVDSRSAPEYYAYQTKTMLRTLVNNPSMDNLAGIVLIAFYESQMQRKDSFRYYAQAAANMAYALNLFDEATAAAFASRCTLGLPGVVSIRSLATQLPQLAG